jgi:hypothetical protein
VKGSKGGGHEGTEKKCEKGNGQSIITSATHGSCPDLHLYGLRKIVMSYTMLFRISRSLCMPT